ncbi:MAG: heterodisulfide reductase-related iron-sulfur binding cluster [Acidimicrobiia bacterium]
MTITYDPHHPKYLDEADVRGELTRVYDLCHGCRLCFKFCSSFPTLFEFIDAHDDQDAAKLTKAQQDQVVDECFQCKLCYINCPYIPGQSEWELDFPRLMLRADAMLHETGQKSKRTMVTNSVMGRTDLVGKVGSLTAPLANAATSKPGSILRKVMAKTAGIAEQRLLPPFAKQRFSTWFRKRPSVRLSKKQGTVALFPTCLVEYQNPAIGQDLVKVYERNGVECSLVDGTMCCGAPWLHSGDIDQFTKQGAKNVKLLADVVRSGKDIVVPQPTCGYVLKKDYVDYVGGPDATLVAENTYDAAEYLMELHKGADTSLDLEFPGDVPESVTYHTPCHLRAQNIGLKSRDLMKLTGTKITLVQQCSGIDGMWGLREENYELSKPVGAKLGEMITAAGGEVVAGDCHLANGAIVEETGRVPVHPIQMVARAYGIPQE